MRTLSLFEADRLTLDDSLAMTADSINTDRTGAPIPGPSGKYGWAWRLPAPQWSWQDLTDISPRNMRLF